MDGCPEADRFTIMPHALAVLVTVEKPSEAISGGRAIRFRNLAFWDLHRRQCRLHFALAEQRVQPKRSVPFCQIFKRRIHAAIAQSGRCRALIGFLPSRAVPAMPKSAFG